VEEKLLNRIISVAYGDADLLDKIKINWLAKNNQEINKLLTDYKNIANQTHTLDLEECPDEIIDTLSNTINKNQQKERSLFFDLYSFIFVRPAISSAILAVFVLAFISTFIFDRPEIRQQYSQQEIEVADQQVKHSLALVASIFNKTKHTVEKDVLTDRVGKPIRESFNLVNEYFIGESKNEKVN